MTNIKRIDLLDLLFDPQSLRRLDWIGIKTNDRVDNQFTIKGIAGDLPSPQGSGSRTSAHIAMGIVNGSMARAPESFLVGEPVRSAPQMPANRNHVVYPTHIANNPEAALEFPSFIDTEPVG